MPSVVVVGGGIVGASIAWHLAALKKAGADVDVTVVAAEVGGTATPNSFSWLNANRGNPRFYYELRRRSLARWHELAALVPGLAAVVDWKGCLQWDEPAAALEAFVEEHASWGYDVQKVSCAAIQAAEPALVDAALPGWGWGVLAAEEGSVEAHVAARVLLAHAESVLGLTLVTGTVSSLATGDSGAGDGHARVTGVTGVVVDGTTRVADHVVVAAGLGTVPLCASIGVAIPVEGRPGLLAHSKPVAKRLLQGIVLSQGPHVRQTVDDGRLLVGANFVGGDADTDTTKADTLAAAESLMAQARALFAADDAALVALDHYTVGVRPDPQDGLPILGDVPGVAGLTVAVTHSGVTLAAVIGEVLAQLVVTGERDAMLAPFSLARFRNVKGVKD